MKYYPTFDYLRIALALVVVAAPGHADLIPWENAGNYAVQVFFALSGWLIGGILLRSKTRDLPRFYFNRAARIWIPYFAAIGLLIGASLLKSRHFTQWAEPFFFDATFTYNLWGALRLDAVRDALPLGATGNHFWSICAEEQFYLMAPCLITLLPAKIGRSLWLWAVLAIGAISSVVWNNFAAISLGVLAAISRVQFGDWYLSPRIRWTIFGAALFGFAAAYSNLMPYQVAGPISSVLIVLFLAIPGEDSKFGTLIGGISYPLYLNHWIGIFLAKAAFERIGLANTTVSRLAALVFAFAVATILYVAIDQNVRRYRAALFTMRRGVLIAIVGFLLLGTGVFSLLLLSGNV